MKLLNLTYNELVKQFKKASTNIIIALILVSAIALPIVMKNIQPNNHYKNRVESAQFMIQDLQSQIDSLQNEKSQKAAIQRKYYGIDKEYQELILNNEISFEDWREVEARALENEMYKLAAMEFVLEGYSKDVVLENLRGEDTKKVENYYDLTLEKKKEIEAGYIAKINELKDVINNNDYNRHTELEIERKEEIIASRKNDISEYEKLYAKNPTDNEGKAKLEELRKSKEASEKDIPKLEQDLAILKFRYDNKIDYDKNNWKNNSIVAIESELEAFRMEMFDEKAFNIALSSETLASSYDEYVENYKKANTLRVEKIKELWYGLENDIPDLGAVKDARSVVDSTYEIYVILAVVVIIIIGGGIVAGEYSNGSIRLLMIRPVARWKILLAKLLAVLIVGFGVVIFGVTILVITSGAVFGFETLKVPVLQTIDGNLIQIDYIKYMLPQLVVSTASLLFIASLVFMISTLARNTALAVAVGMLIYIGAGPLCEILISFKQIWLINTLIPYINGSYFKLFPNLLTSLRGSGMDLNYTLGANQLLIVSIIMLVITFVTFMKKDIKN
ncbi:ABC transporter permease subunit [Clostridium butyricum]|uniref:Putative bacitracin transport permease protein BcrB n=1 Tax=Clostridium butyricum E4 str. BoNT E BL5262 TaxID=632245 RepID=C4ILS7_CLOBU|nr:ABC transporter permease subunit [Clostridium butyricum]APF24454.1 ABC-2 transporter family protein [Clostridium butyricum]EDT74611.1 putative ABC transporter, permease; bacitracin transport permease [Clostridium butyricum 5521]EEP52750.1 putative bacitracin transport permease protein BcrB [Clostridium butyricum E4 str. BoNT E BL5262]MCQ2012078.1 ABC transporter permease subunit [Clostridium butyricum]MCQ2024484.1 ABC transporter permease subunit [Clostridium butyricum]